MKTKSSAHHKATPTEDEIREYAHHLYVQSGWVNGRDIDNWLEAERALLLAERDLENPAPIGARRHLPKAHAPATM
jgi:hypothetical protein